MKSIIEEASSIGKAIQNAWKRANQPHEFSIRIFEMPQKNMFGFTTKSAKIGIFYDEGKKSNDKNHITQPQHHQPSAPREKEREKVARPVATKEKEPVVRPIAKPKKADVEQSEPWNKEMVAFTQEWMNSLLSQLHVDKKFTLTPERYHLKITFNKALFDHEDKNRAFFRNCAHLLLQSIRNNFKRPLKGFKVVLTVE